MTGVRYFLSLILIAFAAVNAEAACEIEQAEYAHSFLSETQTEIGKQLGPDRKEITLTQLGLGGLQATEDCLADRFWEENSIGDEIKGQLNDKSDKVWVYIVISHEPVEVVFSYIITDKQNNIQWKKIVRDDRFISGIFHADDFLSLEIFVFIHSGLKGDFDRVLTGQESGTDFLVIDPDALDLTPPSPSPTRPKTDIAIGTPMPRSSTSSTYNKPYDIVKVYYATNREREFSSPLLGDPEYYNGNDDRAVNYGVANISIPKNHQRGQVERPSIWSFEFRSDPEKHVTIHSLNVTDVDSFYDQVNTAREQATKKEALLYIHGYNVPFNDSLYNAAVLSYDMAFKGVTFNYSWPSDAKLSQYMSDRTDSERSVPMLVEFLKGLSSRGGFDKIHIIAHSMGNDLLTRSIEQWHFREAQSRATPLFDQMILTAPDVDIETFRDRYSGIMPQYATRVSLYGSNKDHALIAASENLNGAPRLGSMDPIVVFPNIDTIDASSTGRSLFEFNLNHSYYLYEEFVDDLNAIVKFNKDPNQRALEQKTIMYQGQPQTYWEL